MFEIFGCAVHCNRIERLLVEMSEREQRAVISFLVDA